jgi:gentisate 1,2-dioxygenase
MVFSVVEGTGTALIGSERFDFEPRDTFVVPSWVPLVLEAKGETVLFSFSDRPGQEAMGLWREKRG